MKTTKDIPEISGKKVVTSYGIFPAILRNVSSVVGFLKNNDSEKNRIYDSSERNIESDTYPEPQNVQKALKYAAIGCLGLIALGLFTSSRSINAG